MTYLSPKKIKKEDQRNGLAFLFLALILAAAILK